MAESPEALVNEGGNRGRHDLPKAMRRLLEFEQRNLWKPERFRASNGRGKFNNVFLPESEAAFRLPYFCMEERYVYTYGKQSAEYRALRMGQEMGSGKEVVFPVHPIETMHYAEWLIRTGAVDSAAEGLRFWATPTSSTRTLLTWQEGYPEGAVFAKVSLRSQLFGDRRLSREKVAGSVGLSSVIQQHSHELPSGIRFFPERLGLVPRAMGGSGVIFRSIPQEVRDGRVMLAPLFALMGGCGEHPPVLLKIMEHVQVGVLEALEEVLLYKFATLWVDLVFDFGLILEAHAQDLLLALSPNSVPQGTFYYRDFEGLAVDWALRRAKGFAEEGPLPHESQWFNTYETWGYPLYQLVSRKMMISLFDYMHLFLGELESAVLQWQASGVIAGTKVYEGELSSLFSRYLREAIRRKYGMQESQEYDVRQHLNRFVKFLMRVRREVMTGHPALANI